MNKAPLATKLAPDLYGWYATPDVYQRGVCRKNIRLVRTSDRPTLSTTLAIYRDEHRVFLFPLILGLSEQITVNLGMADSDFIEAVYRNTDFVAKSYYNVSGLSSDKALPDDSFGLVFVGICQTIDYEALQPEAPAGNRNWGGRYYFVTTSPSTEGSELAELIKALNPEGGCVMASDILYANDRQGNPNEPLVEAILKEPHKFFMHDFGSPLEERFKHAVVCKFDQVDYVDKNPQRILLGFGFRINYNLSNRLMPAEMRKERFVIPAYREALRRKPDLFACFGMKGAQLVERRELDFFYDTTPPMQLLINGSRFYTPTCVKGELQEFVNIEQPEVLVGYLKKVFMREDTEMSTAGVMFGGLRTLFVPQANDTNILALKHQIEADREPLAFTTTLSMRVKRK